MHPNDRLIMAIMFTWLRQLDAAVEMLLISCADPAHFPLAIAQQHVTVTPATLGPESHPMTRDPISPIGLPAAVPVCSCRKCGHTWLPRTPRNPRRCPNCGAYDWQNPKQRQQRIEQIASEHNMTPATADDGSEMTPPADDDNSPQA